MSSDDNKGLFLVGIGDTHIGEIGWNSNSRAKFGEYIDFIEEHNCKVILMGDLVNAASKSSAASPFTQNMNLDDQMDYVVNLLAPIKDKIIGSITGNHENNAFKVAGFFPTKAICQMLGVPYWKFSQIVEIKVNEIKYKVKVAHGFAGGRTLGNKWNGIDKIKNNVGGDIDIVLVGHSHMLGAVPVLREFYDKKKGRKWKVIWLISTGAFLDYEGTYVDQKALPGLPLGTPVLYLSGEKKNIGVWINLNSFNLF